VRTKRDELQLVLEGPDQNPAAADPVTTLDLARAYFDLLKRIASEHGSELVMRGLRIRKGSMVVASSIPVPDIAIQLMTDASRYIGGTLPPPPRLERYVEDVRGKIVNLPGEVAVATRCGDAVLPLNPHDQEARMPPRETTELRAIVITVGGAKRPFARFTSRSEDRQFSLHTDIATAQRLGKLLYSAVDLTAVVQRDEKGFIHSGVLEDFTPVNSGVDEVNAWRDWFREAGPAFSDVDAVDHEDAADQEPDRV
jgi:hypothetical protein